MARRVARVRKEPPEAEIRSSPSEELSSEIHETFNYVIDGDVVVVEGTSIGETADGTGWWPDGTPGGGRWCDVFEVRNGEIQRLFIYLDPDYAGRDTAQYPWL